MELAVHGKQMDVGDALRTRVEDRLGDLNAKYFNHATYASVTFSRDGHGHKHTKAHITMQLGKNIMVMADAIDLDPKAAFDLAGDKAEKQLRKYKSRLRDHHEKIERVPENEFLKAREYALESAPDQDNVEAHAEPLVIAEMTMNIQTLSVSEAVMRLDLGGQGALLFRNASHNGLNMVYRRSDGNIGWVDPEQNCKTTTKK